MKIKSIVAILIFSSIYFGCRRPHLYDEREVLIGKWNYSYSTEFYGCTPTGYTIIPSDSLDDNFEIEITKQEKIYWMKNGEVQAQYPLEVTYFDSSSRFDNGYAFSILFDSSQSQSLGGFVNQDSLMIDSYWPDSFVPGSCEEYRHYYSKGGE